MATHAYTREGVLLLARGELVIDAAQLERLLREDVLFSDAPPLSSPAPPILADLSALPRRPPSAPAPSEAPRREEPAPAPRRYEEEVPAARRLRSAAMHQLDKVLSEVESGRPVNLSGVRGVVREMMGSLQRNEQALLSLARLRTTDDYTFTHSVNTCAFSLLLARAHGLEEISESVGMGALLHDVGKVAVPLELLHKPTCLTEEEWQVVRKHPAAGLDLLQIQDPVAERAVGQHHERLDGRGYPLGLRDPDIHVAGKIVAIADIYDAMTSCRPYHDAHSPAHAMHWIFQNGGTHVDSRLALSFVQSMGIYPVGTVVRLSTDELAVVAKVNPRAVHCPCVVVFGQARGVIYERPKWLDLAEGEGRAKGSPTVVEALPSAVVDLDLEKYLIEVEAEAYRLSKVDSQA